MRYLVVHGEDGGTGIRDYYEGLDVRPEELGLSQSTIERINNWLKEYEDEFHNINGSYSNSERIDALDKEGRAISHLILSELPDIKIQHYLSDARMIQYLIQRNNQSIDWRM